MGVGGQAGDDLVHRIVADWKTADLSPGDLALCDFAAKLSHKTSSMSREDLERLRAEGLDDRAIHDAAQVIGFFNYITRIADGLGVEAEEFIEEWGVGERFSDC